MAGEIVELEGVVCSGLGEGRRFTRLGWAEAAFRAKLGFAPYPGTFNLLMRGAGWQEARRRLLAGEGLLIVPPAGFCSARCYPLRLADCVAGAAVFPDVPGYPLDKMEVVAPVSVRETLGVSDGATVKLRVEIP
jgi:CTP-dependent riboflavin kinase